MRHKPYLIFSTRQELSKTLLSCLALFFLLVSYYLVKPLRNSLYLAAFTPEYLPYAFLFTAAASFVVTRLYTQFYGRLPKRTLIMATYSLTAALMLFFHFALQKGSHAITAGFYIFASVYFLLAIALIWGLINDVFTSREGERCYGYVAMGSTIGGIMGSVISDHLASSEFSDYPLLVAAVLTLLALGLVMSAHSSYGRVEEVGLQVKKASSADILADLRLLFQKPYIRAIGLMVFALAFFNTNMEFRIQATVDESLAKSRYEVAFDGVHESVDMAWVRGLRALKPDLREKSIQEKIGKTGIEDLKERYETYHMEKEKETRSFFSEVFKWQGVLSIFVLSILIRPLFKKVGVAMAVLILPSICLVATGMMATGPELGVIWGLMVVVGSLNYSLNNASKELLFTATDDEDRFRLKPLIEGPIMRFGDVSASVSKLSLAQVFASAALVQGVLFSAVVAVIFCWMVLAWQAGKRYESMRVVHP